MASVKLVIFQYVMVVYMFYNPTNSGAVKLTSENIDMTLASNELVLINFYTACTGFTSQFFSSLLRYKLYTATRACYVLFRFGLRHESGKVYQAYEAETKKQSGTRGTRN